VKVVWDVPTLFRRGEGEGGIKVGREHWERLAKEGLSEVVLTKKRVKKSGSAIRGGGEGCEEARI